MWLRVTVSLTLKCTLWLKLKEVLYDSFRTVFRSLVLSAAWGVETKHVVETDKVIRDSQEFKGIFVVSMTSCGSMLGYGTWCVKLEFSDSVHFVHVPI